MAERFGKKRWRYSLGRHYYEDDKYGYAYVDKRGVKLWLWSGPHGHGESGTLKAAKAAAERDVRRRR